LTLKFFVTVVLPTVVMTTHRASRGASVSAAVASPNSPSAVSSPQPNRVSAASAVR
jgi:hypothetical protein